jgi:Outer membrane protein beta-barrel domain
LQFVDIPFSLKLKTNNIGYMRYYGQFGFLAGFMVKANQDVDFDENNFGYTDKTKRNNQSDFGFFNFGLNVGLGIEYNIAGNTDITVGLGYHNAFVDIWKEDDAKLTSNYLTLNFGVFF